MVPVQLHDSGGIMLLPMAVAGVIVAPYAADGRPRKGTGGLGGNRALCANEAFTVVK